MAWRARWAADEVSFGWWPRFALSALLVLPILWVLGGIVAIAAATVGSAEAGASGTQTGALSKLPSWLADLALWAGGGDIVTALFRATAGVILLLGAHRWLGDIWRPTHGSRLEARAAARMQREAQNGLTPLPPRISDPEQPPPQRW